MLDIKKILDVTTIKVIVKEDFGDIDEQLYDAVMVVLAAENEYKVKEYVI